MADNKEKIINPKEIASIVRTKTFAISNELAVSECSGYSSPLMFYSSKFSQFKAVIINEQKKVAYGNIKSCDVGDIEDRSKFIYNKDMEASMSFSAPAPEPKANSGVDESLAIAYTVTLTTGNGLKGKSPAQVLLENPEKGPDMLTNQYKWLKNNRDTNEKFRESNQKQMDAIMAASKLFKEGKLSVDGVASNQSMNGRQFTIYEPGMRPLTRKKNAKGNSFVYEILVTYTIGNKYPVEVTITNYYAPVTQDKDGLLNVKVSQKENEIKNSMRLTAKEWNNAVEMMQINKRTFEMCYAQSLYSASIAAEKANRAEAGVSEQ